MIIHNIRKTEIKLRETQSQYLDHQLSVQMRLSSGHPGLFRFPSCTPGRLADIYISHLMII